MNNKKSLRLLITEECNLNCSYCCNKLPKCREKFDYKRLKEINFSQYDAVCITGGEPMLNPAMLGYIKEMCNIDLKIPIYLYTNGLLLSKQFPFKDFTGITIGIHKEWQMKTILECAPKILSYGNIRFSVEDIHREEYLSNIPDKYIRTWIMNDCYKQFDNEDIVVLRD
jgi:organic radical activating enzyme